MVDWHLGASYVLNELDRLETRGYGTGQYGWMGLLGVESWLFRIWLSRGTWFRSVHS